MKKRHHRKMLEADVFVNRKGLEASHLGATLYNPNYITSPAKKPLATQYKGRKEQP